MADIVLLANGPLANHLSSEIELCKSDFYRVSLFDVSSVQRFEEKIVYPFVGKLRPILEAQKPRHVTLVGDLRWLLMPGPSEDDGEAQLDTYKYWRDEGPTRWGTRAIDTAVWSLWFESTQWAVTSTTSVKMKHPAQLLRELTQEDWTVGTGFLTSKDIFRPPNGLSPEAYIEGLIERTILHLTDFESRSIRQSVSFDGLELEAQPYEGTDALLKYLIEQKTVPAFRSLVKLRSPHLPQDWDPPALNIHILERARQAHVKLIVIDSTGLIEAPADFLASATEAGISIYGINTEEMVLDREG